MGGRFGPSDLGRAASGKYSVGLQGSRYLMMNSETNPIDLANNTISQESRVDASSCYKPKTVMSPISHNCNTN